MFDVKGSYFEYAKYVKGSYFQNAFNVKGSYAGSALELDLKVSKNLGDIERHPNTHILISIRPRHLYQKDKYGVGGGEEEDVLMLFLNTNNKKNKLDTSVKNHAVCILYKQSQI